jgi:hypothetical protein
MVVERIHVKKKTVWINWAPHGFRLQFRFYGSAKYMSVLT